MAIDWTEIPNNQKDMYDRWTRFSVGNLNADIRQANKYKDPSVPSDCIYQYDSANNRIYNTINTESLVGIVSPDRRSDHYVFDGQLKTFSTSDNDPIGFVIAYVKMPNGDVHTLTAMRSTFGKSASSDPYGFWLEAPMTIVKDYMTHAPYRVAEGFGGLKYYNGRIPTVDNKFVPESEHNPATNWMSFAPNGFRIRVTRVRDIITVETSQLNESTLLPSATITINLAEHPELEIFRPRCHYGFCSVSQDRVYWGGTIKHPVLRTPFWLSDVHDNYGTHGWMTDAAEAGGIWKRDPVDLKDVFNKWRRFSRGNRHSQQNMVAYGLNDMAEPAECAAFYYDEATNRIGNPLNTNTLVGFVSPEVYDSFLLDVTITSLSNWQVDPVGLVLARATDPDGTVHTLTIMRCGYSPNTPHNPTQWFIEDAPMQVSVDYHTSRQVTIAKGYFGLRYNGGFVPTPSDPYWNHPGGFGGSTDFGFDKFPKGVRIRVDRNGDVINIATSQYNDTTFWPGATLSIDLNSRPELARFKGPGPYGFCCISQDLVSWDATIRPGGWRRPFWMSEFAQKPQSYDIVFDANNYAFMSERDLLPKMLAAAGGKWPTDVNTEWNIKVNPGVVLIAAEGKPSCMQFGGVVNGVITLENYGQILGRGGNGASYYNALAGNGTCAIYREPKNKMIVKNHGVIAGGGGGGGGTQSLVVGMGAGGGGRPFGLGGADNGENATLDRPGRGGMAYDQGVQPIGPGGSGGDLGVSGNIGGGPYGNGKPGNPGNSFSGSGEIEWSVRGDVRGPVS